MVETGSRSGVNMIRYPAIRTIFQVAVALLILASWLTARSGRLGSKSLRNGLTAAGVVTGVSAFSLPFFEQPVLRSIVLNYIVGIPLAVFGLLARVYPMMYLRKRATTTTLSDVARIIDTGPYGIVRHPQYVGGILMLIGWFLLWGASYCLHLVPLIALLILTQASIEEKHILGKKLGGEYETYRERVGMFFPKLKRRRQE